MINRKLKSALSALAISFGMANAANALNIQAGDYLMVLQNLDSATVNYGDTPGVKCSTVNGCDTVPGISPSLGSIGSVNTSADTMGIFTVQSITRVGEFTPYFSGGGPDGFLTAVFGNLTDRQVSVADNAGNGSCSVATPGGCTTTARAVGGNFSLWANTNAPNTGLGPAVGAGKDLNALLYPSISNTGTLFLSGVFAPGVILGDLLTTFESRFINGTISGGSSGYLDFTGGSALSIFNTNGEFDPNGGAHDARADFTFSLATGAAATAGWNATSVAQVQGAVIPEPGSLALVALALLCVGAVTRRHKV